MRGVHFFGRILRQAAALPPSICPASAHLPSYKILQKLASSEVRSCRYLLVKEASTSMEVRSPQGHLMPSDAHPTLSLASPSVETTSHECNLVDPDEDLWKWCFRRVPGAHTVWEHQDPANQNRMSARDYVQQKNTHPIQSVYLFGENWKTEVTSRAGITLIAGTAELFEDMRLKGWCFYEPVNADMFTVDECGKLHIADGVLLRLSTQFSRSLDIIFGADTLEDLLFSWSSEPLKYPGEVIDFLHIMRSPHLQPEYLMLIHPAGVQRHLRGPMFMRYFDFVIHCELDEDDRLVRDHMFLYMKASGYMIGATKDNMLLGRYKGMKHYPNEPRDWMYFRRVGENHVFGFWKMFAANGFPYTREEQQLLLHARCGMFCSIIQRFLFCVMGKDSEGRGMLKALKSEEFLCQIGVCCPMGECKRDMCFDSVVLRRCKSKDPEIISIIRAANIIKSHSCSPYIIKRPKWLALYAGDVVELLFEPKHHHPSKQSLSKRLCYVRGPDNKEGFVHVKFLQEYFCSPEVGALLARGIKTGSFDCLSGFSSGRNC